MSNKVDFQDVKNYVPSMNEVSALFGIAPKTISRWHAKGVFTKGDPLYKICASIAGFAKTHTAAGSNTSAAEKLKMAQYLRTLEQTEVGRQKIRDRVLNDVKDVLKTFFGAFKNKLMEYSDDDKKRMQVIAALDAALKDAEEYLEKIEASRPSIAEEVEKA